MASRIRSRLSGSQPAMVRALDADAAHRSIRDSDGPSTRRAAIPVRLRIQLSLVSTRWPRSALLIERDGVALPQPLSSTPADLNGCATKEEMGTCGVSQPQQLCNSAKSSITP